MMAAPQFLTPLARRILFVPTCASFLPHYLRIFELGNCDGISGLYVLFGLTSAAIHFSWSLITTALLYDREFSSNQRLEDRLDTIQFGLCWLCHLCLSLLYITFESSLGAATITKVVLGYIGFLIITLAPGLLLIYIHRTDHSVYKGWGIDLYGCGSAFAWIFLLTPAATGLTIAAFVCQWRALGESNHSALSSWGLMLQFIAFLILGLSWLARFTGLAGLSNGITEPYGFIVRLLVRYAAANWATVDHILFAVGQLALWWRTRY